MTRGVGNGSWSALGDQSGPVGFWSIETFEERNLVRECFEKTLMSVILLSSFLY